MVFFVHSLVLFLAENQSPEPILNFENLTLDDMPTPIVIRELEKLLFITGYDDNKSRYLLQGFTRGFDLGYQGPYERQDSARNLPLNVGSKTDLWNKLMVEVELGRTAGPFAVVPFMNFVQSPIGLVPKSNGKTRLIFHLSYDFGPLDAQKSINYHTPKEVSTVHYRDLDYAIRMCLHLKKQLMSIDQFSNGIFLAKTDLKSAFKILPILVKQRCLLVMRTTHPETGEWFYFVEKTVPFGSHASCALFQSFSDCLQFIMEKITNKNFTVTNYLDDFLFIGKDQTECDYLVSKFLAICQIIGCPVAEEKTVVATQQIVFLGILLDGQSYVLSVPVEKCNKAIAMLQYVVQQRKVTIRQIQRLAGLLNFLNKAIVPGRTFTRSLYDKLRMKDSKGNLLKPHHHVYLTKRNVLDCQIWQLFLQGSPPERLCRPFVDLDLYSDSRTLDFYTDSTLNENLGIGGIYGTRWFSKAWPVGFVRTCEPCIGFVELYALVVGILTWGSELVDSRLVIYCDNEPVMNMVNSFTTKCNYCLKLLRVLVLDNLIHNRRVFVRHVRTESNTLADSLSRLDMRRFWKYAPENTLKKADLVPETIWPPNKFFMD